MNNNAEVNFIRIIYLMKKWREIKMNCKGTMRIFGELFHNDSNMKESMTL